MEKFCSLPPQRQRALVDAALQVFGAMGYKKASVADIAAACGVSKPLVFYYFGSKKALYLYLMQFSSQLITREISAGLHSDVTDFFEKIRQSAALKMEVLRQYPGVFPFLTSMYYETDAAVVAEIREMIAQGEAYSNAFATHHIDLHKFKPDVNPQLVMEILTCYTEGYLSQCRLRTPQDMDALLNRFYECLALMKRHFYKDEFCSEAQSP